MSLRLVCLGLVQGVAVTAFLWGSAGFVLGYLIGRRG